MVLISRTRCEYIPVRSTAASLRPTVLEIRTPYPAATQSPEIAKFKTRSYCTKAVRSMPHTPCSVHHYGAPYHLRMSNLLYSLIIYAWHATCTITSHKAF